MVALMVLVGLDFLRIVDSIRYWLERVPIERLYLLYDRKRDVFGMLSRRNVSDLSRVLSFAMREPVRIGINPQSFEDSFSVLYAHARYEVEQGRKVLIDATSTTKEAYGAALMVSFILPEVEVFITPPRVREWYLPEPDSPAFEDWFRRVRSIQGGDPILLKGPKLRDSFVDNEEALILVILHKHGGHAPSIKDLITWCGADPKSASVKNRFGRLLRRLQAKGLVVCGIGSKRKSVTLTSLGNALANGISRYISIRSSGNAFKESQGEPLPVSADSSLYLEEEKSPPAKMFEPASNLPENS